MPKSPLVGRMWAARGASGRDGNRPTPIRRESKGQGKGVKTFVPGCTAAARLPRKTLHPHPPRRPRRRVAAGSARAEYRNFFGETPLDPSAIAEDFAVLRKL